MAVASVTPSACAAALVLLGVSVCTAISWEVGAAHPVVRHLFYLPVIFAAIGLTVVVLIRRPPLRRRGGLDDQQMAKDLRDALSRGGLEMHYQPVVSLTHFQIVAVEALTRWNHPRLGPIAPDVFIPVAERCGIIRALGTWALEAACQQIVDWRSAGALPNGRLQVGVNVSGEQLADPRFPGDVERVVHATGLDPTWLTLEVTETAPIRDVAQAAKGLSALLALGIRVAVDDYGTGYGSLSYLRDLPTDILKIDRKFVGTMTIDRHDAAIVASIVELAHRLDKITVAEGVETVEQVHALVDLGCQYAQGYLFARPGPPDVIKLVLSTSVPPIIFSP